MKFIALGKCIIKFLKPCQSFHKFSDDIQQYSYYAIVVQIIIKNNFAILYKYLHILVITLHIKHM